MPLRCPACGHPITDKFTVHPAAAYAVIDGRQYFVRPAEARILEILRRNMGSRIHGDTIAELTGLSRNAIAVHATHIREAIYHSRLVLEGQVGKNGGYWLRWLPER